MDRYGAGKSAHSKVSEKLKDCQTAGLLSEGGINQMGYQYLYDFEQPKLAQAIFKCNTEFYPHSANVFDSYGEALALNGQQEEAIAAYQTAVKLAEKHQDPNLDLFRENLKKVREKN